MKVGCHALHSQNGNEKSSVMVMLILKAKAKELLLHIYHVRKK